MTLFSIAREKSDFSPDGVASFHTNPLRDWSVLLDLFSQLHFHTETFVGTLKINAYN